MKILFKVVLISSFLIVSGCCKDCIPGKFSDRVEDNFEEAKYLRGLDVFDLQNQHARSSIVADCMREAVVISNAILIDQNGLGHDETRMFSEEEISRVLDGSTEMVSLDPVTVGAVFFSLKSILQDLQSLIESATNDIVSIGESLEGNLIQVINEFDEVLGKRLDKTVSQLEGIQRRMVEDSQLLIHRTQAAILAIERQAFEDGKKLLLESDILAYNTLSYIPCADDIPRMVYLEPNVFRYNPIKDEYTIKVRGNYLGAYSKPEMYLNTSNGKVPVELFSSEVNELTIKLPKELFSTITDEKTFSLGGDFSGCQTGFLRAKKISLALDRSLAFKVKPALKYTIEASITPTAERPQTRNFNYPFYNRRNSCKGSHRVDRNWCLPSKWEIESYSNQITGQRCGSNIEGIQQKGKRCVLVRGKVESCGRTFYGGCKGHGVLGYRLTIRAKKYTQHLLSKHSQSIPTSENPQESYVFQYPGSKIPSDARNIHWTYTVRVNIQDGSNIKTIVLTERNTSNSGIATDISRQGKLTLELPSSIEIATQYLTESTSIYPLNIENP